MDISHKLFLRHSHMPNSDRQTENLLHLELDGRLKVKNLLVQVVTVSHQRRELTSLVQAGSKKSGNLLN